MTAAMSYREAVRALEFTAALAGACGAADAFARAAVRLVPGLVSSDETTLTVFDLGTGRRALVRCAPSATARRAAQAPGSTPARDGRLPATIDRPAYPAHAMSVPLWADHRWSVSLTLQRRRPPFLERERALLEAVRPQFAALHRLSFVLAGARDHDLGTVEEPVRRGLSADATGGPPAASNGCQGLTRREFEIGRWLVAGKTSRDIATLVGASPRTVDKHLEHIFQKLGVETRTAAAMRLIQSMPRPSR